MSAVRETSAGASALRFLAPVVVGLLLVGLWLLLVALDALPKAVPSPVAIGDEFVARFGIILDAARITGGNALWGLLIGAAVAIVLAGIAAAIRVVDWMFAPVVMAIAVIPIVALTPVFNNMFGASTQTGRILIAAIAAFIPVYVNLLRGLRQAVPVQRDLFTAVAATSGQRFRKLTLPTAIPYLVTGLRIAGSLAVISALVAEYFGGPADGLGTAIATYAKSGRAALAWAFVAASIIVGLAFFLVTALIERIARARVPI